MDRGRSIFSPLNGFIFLQRSKIMKYAKFIFCLLFILGCSPAQRLERLQRKHPELFKEKQDTVILNDITYDTLIDIIGYTDTFTAYDTVTRTKVIQIFKRDTIFRTIKPKQPKTILITKYKTIQAPREKDFKFWSFDTLGKLLFFSILLLCIIFVIGWKIFK